MENIIIESEPVVVNTKPKRPTLLTVLCILTFIASAFNILGYGLLSIMPADAIADAMENMADNMGGMMSPIEMLESFAIVKMTAPYILILSILNLVGAIMMFQLKKMGFYLYVLAQVGMLLVAPLVTGVWNISMSGALFTILFIALYAMNLKYMYPNPTAKIEKY